MKLPALRLDMSSSFIDKVFGQLTHEDQQWTFQKLLSTVAVS